MTQQIAATILDKDTYLVSFNVIKKIAAKIKSKIGATPNTTPALVATAFPPLNLRKTGKTCPIIANTPTIIPCVKNSLIGPVVWIGNHSGKKTTIKPLNISKKVTANPAGRPNTRKLLVAPVLPLPYCLISFLKNNFPIMIPLGNEPTK